jgi:hypothetical protein
MQTDTGSWRRPRRPASHVPQHPGSSLLALWRCGRRSLPPGVNGCPVSTPRHQLHSLVEGFDWETLESTLLQALPGGKGRDLREMGRFQRGHVCTILNEGVYTIWWHRPHCAARSAKRNFLSFWVSVHIYIRINYAAPDLMWLSAWQNSSNFVLGWVSDIQSWSCLCLGKTLQPCYVKLSAWLYVW